MAAPLSWRDAKMATIPRRGWQLPFRSIATEPCVLREIRIANTDHHCWQCVAGSSDPIQPGNQTTRSRARPPFRASRWATILMRDRDRARIAGRLSIEIMLSWGCCSAWRNRALRLSGCADRHEDAAVVEAVHPLKHREIKDFKRLPRASPVAHLGDRTGPMSEVGPAAWMRETRLRPQSNRSRPPRPWNLDQQKISIISLPRCKGTSDTVRSPARLASFQGIRQPCQRYKVQFRPS